jgi:uncharacterized protein
LLWGAVNLREFLKLCASISERTGTYIGVGLTTNGLLINAAYLELFEEFDVSVTLSIDGPAHIHDINRRSFQDTGTHAAVEQAFRLLQSRGLASGALAVCDPNHDPKEFFDYFRELGLDGYDILVPDAIHGDEPRSIASFYKGLFDLWMEANSKERSVSIRIIEAMVAGLLGGTSTIESIGHVPVGTCTVLTDGTMEPLDVLRIAGEGSTRSSTNIFKNRLQDIVLDQTWLAARSASTELCEECRRCKFMHACGGGYLPHRFSKERGYDNPSVYCRDLYEIFTHIQRVLAANVFLAKDSGARIPFEETLRSGCAPQAVA